MKEIGVESKTARRHEVIRAKTKLVDNVENIEHEKSIFEPCII